MEPCDVVVVGVGPGGEYAANKLGAAGLDVVVVEELLVGGECPFFGCTPSKLMIRAADLLAEGRRLPALAGRAEITPDYTLVAERIRASTNDWHDDGHAERLARSGVRVVRGHGRLDGWAVDGSPRVVVDLTDGGTEEFTARKVVLNPGTRPGVPEVPGLAGTPFLTNRDVFTLNEAPESLVVIGGGPVGCELAQSFARFGSRVSLVQRSERLMPREEPEVGDLLAGVFAHEGIELHTRTAPDRVAYGPEGFTVTCGEHAFTGSHLLVATGRAGNLDGLGLDTIGLDPAAGVVPTDEWMRAAEGVYVVGDVTGHGAFTHVSRYQAEVVVRDVLGRGGAPAEYHSVSRATFTDPEIGSVGLTERAARARGFDVAVGTADIARSSRGWIHGADTAGLIKVVADRERDVLVGATAVAPSGGEVIGLLAAAVHAEIPIPQLRRMHYAYLTFHRAIETALKDLT